MHRNSLHKVGTGVLGLLAVAGGLVATTTPAWASDVKITLENNTPYALNTSLPGLQTLTVPAHGHSTQTLSSGDWWHGTNLFSNPQTDKLGWLYFNAAYNFYDGGTGFSYYGTTISCNVSGELPFTHSLTGNSTTGYICTFGGSIGSRAAGKSAAHARFWANYAPLQKGFARVPVVTYSNSKKAVKERIILRNAKTGQKISERTVRVKPRDPKRVKLALDAKTKRAVHAGKPVKVRAIVKHADGTKGTGHRFTIRITRP